MMNRKTITLTVLALVNSFQNIHAMGGAGDFTRKVFNSRFATGVVFLGGYLTGEWIAQQFLPSDQCVRISVDDLIPLASQKIQQHYNGRISRTQQEKKIAEFIQRYDIKQDCKLEVVNGKLYADEVPDSQLNDIVRLLQKEETPPVHICTGRKDPLILRPTDVELLTMAAAAKSLEYLKSSQAAHEASQVDDKK